MRSRLRDDEGFTLIELLIVIIVIGVLAGIAILAFEPFQQSATEACDEANIRISETAEAAQQAGVNSPIGQEADC
jgi:prepilin-type N-terminal cleavage/methylation domain-containing protein